MAPGGTDWRISKTNVRLLVCEFPFLREMNEVSFGDIFTWRKVHGMEDR